MNILTAGDLTVDGAPLLRAADEEHEDQEEFLLSTFSGVTMHITPEEDEEEAGDDENACMNAPAEAPALNDTAGDLYVTTKRVLWIGDRSAPRVGYGWEVNQITLHAISRDPAAYPEPCLYCQVGIEDITEVRFVPAEEKQLVELFTAFSKSAEMNPDEDDDDEDVEGGLGDGWIYDEDEVENGARAAEIAAHLDSVLEIAPGFERKSMQHEAGQFDDAEEDELL